MLNSLTHFVRPLFLSLGLLGLTGCTLFSEESTVISSQKASSSNSEYVAEEATALVLVENGSDTVPYADTIEPTSYTQEQEVLGSVASKIFSSIKLPSESPLSFKGQLSRVFGGYSKGCIAGAEKMPMDGDTWQVMRPKRNRMFGHPELLETIKAVSRRAPEFGWRGILVGDMSQPRGGPSLGGHVSHQSGLDSDIWFTQMPTDRMSNQERNDLSATNMIKSRTEVSKAFGSGQIGLLKAMATREEVDRIFVNPAIKKALCDRVSGNRDWLRKIRPWWGHNYHFHVRLRCPSNEPFCLAQSPIPAGDGCDASLENWLNPPPPKPKDKDAPPPPKPEPVRVQDMPLACQQLAVD